MSVGCSALPDVQCTGCFALANVRSLKYSTVTNVNSGEYSILTDVRYTGHSIIPNVQSGGYLLSSCLVWQMRRGGITYLKKEKKQVSVVYNIGMETCVTNSE
jgi:hypothetical protein